MTNQCKQRYDQGKIYQIVNDINDQVYIGSTCMPLSKRLYGHKKDCENHPTTPRQLFQLAREHGWAHFCIRLVEYWPCGDNEQLRMREQHHIDLLKQDSPELCLNMNRAYTSKAAKCEQKRHHYIVHCTFHSPSSPSTIDFLTPLHMPAVERTPPPQLCFTQHRHSLSPSLW